MHIRDPIHKDIELSETEIKIIDSAEFQRLRHIKQLGFSYLVYPGANHTRFEHSLGTLYLSKRIAEKIGVDKEDLEKIRIYALLHDIGHIGFSHDGEPVFSKYIGNHEELGRKRIKNSEIKDIVNERFDIKQILEFDKSKYYQIIASSLGADRMDYLVRDSAYTGVAYGVIDIDRIISTIDLNENEQKLFVYEKGIESSESLLIARYLMFSTVYLHPVSQIAANMFQKAMELAIQNGLDLKALGESVDSSLLEMLKQNDKSRALIQRLIERRLYKRAYFIPIWKIKENRLRSEEIKKEIKSIEDTEIIVAKPYEFIKDEEFLVKTRTGFTTIEKYSKLVESLKSAQKEKIGISVLCNEKEREKINEICKRLFD